MATVEKKDMLQRRLTREHLLSSKMLRVWIASGDRQNMGKPEPSLAKSVSVPKGKPALRWCMLDIRVQRCAILACSTCPASDVIQNLSYLPMEQELWLSFALYANLLNTLLKKVLH